MLRLLLGAVAVVSTATQSAWAESPIAGDTDPSTRGGLTDGGGNALP
jgi:hypothetical protein